MGLEELFRQQQAVSSNGAGSSESFPILAGLTGFKDVKKSVLDLLSANGGILNASTDATGLFRETKWSKGWQEGFKNVGSSKGGGMEMG